MPMAEQNTRFYLLLCLYRYLQLVTRVGIMDGIRYDCMDLNTLDISLPKRLSTMSNKNTPLKLHQRTDWTLLQCFVSSPYIYQSLLRKKIWVLIFMLTFFTYLPTSRYVSKDRSPSNLSNLSNMKYTILHASLVAVSTTINASRIQQRSLPSKYVQEARGRNIFRSLLAMRTETWI